MTIHRRPPLIPYDVQPQGASVVYWAHGTHNSEIKTLGIIKIKMKPIMLI